MPSIDFLESLSASTNQNLSKVSEEALASLRSTSYVESAQQAAAQEAQRRQALLAEDTDNPLSYLTNVAATALAGVSETVGYVASAPIGLGTMDLLTVSDEAKAAYIRYRNAKDSGTTYEGIDKDEALLNQKVKRKVTSTGTMSNTYTYGVDVAPEAQSVEREGSKTNLEAIEYGLGAANLQKDIKDFFNLESIVNKENQDVITKAAEVADAKFAATLDTAISKIKEGKVLDGVSDIAAGAADAVFDTFDKVEDPLDAAKAVGELTAEVIGDVALGLLGKTGSALQTVSSIGYGSDAFATAIVDFHEKNGRLPTTEELQKQLKLASSLTLAEQAGDLFALDALTKGRKALDAAAKVSTTSLTEAATEAYQTIVEESLIKLEEPNYKGAFTSGLMGALAGGGAASVRPAIEAAKAVTGKAGEAVSNKVKNAEFVQKRKAQKEAIETGNLEPVTNTESPTFDLNTSVDTLAKRNQVEGITPEERTQNYETAKEQVLSKQAELVQLTNEYVELESKTERTPEEQTRLQELDTLVPKLEESISKAAPIVRAMRPTVVNAEQVSNDIEAATKNDTEAARRVFGSFRDNPTSLSESQAIALAEADNGLSEEENQILKTYAEVQKNLRTFSQVSDNIINGGTDPQTKRKMLGIKDYQNMILSGDEAIKTKGLEGLKLFAERQTSKATQLEDALVKATNTGKPVQVGSLKISNNSKRLVSKVREEANLLNQVYQQYSSIPSVEPAVQSPTEEVTTEQPIVDTVSEQTVEEVTQPQQPEVVSETVEQVTDTPVQPSVVTPVEAEASPVTTTVEPALDITEDKDYSLAKELTSKEGNLVSEYFKPSNKQSALNKIANFSSKLKLDTENILKQFYGSVVPTGAMEVATEFTKFNDSFGKALDEIFAVKKEFIGNDFTQYLVDESGNLPENVKTAMAAGAYQWIVSSGKESNYQSEESMRGLLGLSDEDYVEPELYNLIPKGVRFQSVVNSMGTAAFKTLNLKLDNNAPIDAQTNLETSLGLWAYSALENSGVLNEAESVTGAQIKSLYGSEAPDSIKKLGDRTTFQLVQLDLTNDIDNIFAANKKQSSFMQDVFGSSYERPMPSFKPVKGNLKVAKSVQQVPESQKRVLEADQAKPYFFRENTVQTFFGFNPELQKEMMGYVSNLDTVIDVNKPSVEGKNRSIERELEIAQEWYEEVQDKGINTPFYLEHTVWKQGRMGIGNKFNPQASKIHRYLVNREWNTTFTFGSPEENFFLLAVGEGLDVEVPKFGSDQNGLASDKALEEVQKQLAKPKVRNAIDAMKDVLRLSGERELTVELQTVIADGVKAIGTNMKGYLSIVAMAEYELAKESDATEFTHNLAREVDGITNGVAITTLQFASDNVEAMFNMLQRMGIYNSNITYNEWIANPANQDSYKTLARDWEKAIQLKAMEDAKYAKDYNVVSKLFGSFIKVNELTGKEEVTKQGRNIAKNPLMTSIYGASIGTIADNIGSQGIEKVYERLEAVYKGLIERTLTQEAARAEVNEVLSIVNYLTGSKRVIRNTKDLKEFKLRPNEVKNFKKVVSGIYQNPLKEAMDKEYKVSFDSRNKLNAATNLAHALFVNMYNKRKAEILKQTGNKQLTVEEEKNLVESLKTVTPIVNTATSKISSKDLTKQLETGLMLSGYEMTPITDRSVQVTINPKNLKSGKKSRTTNGQLRTYSEPGAAAIPTMTQSIDAAVQLVIMNIARILNVHDAAYIAGSAFKAIKEAYNKGFLLVNSLYSIPQEIGVMLNRVVTGFDGDIKELEEPIIKAAKTVLGRDAKWVAQRGLQQTLNDINSFITSLGQDHVNNKNKVMNNIVRSEQYSNGEDSAYVRPTNNLGSSAYTDIRNDFTFDEARRIDGYNSEQVFDELQQVSLIKDEPEHLEYLRGVLNNVVNKVVQPFDLHLGASDQTETIGATDGVDMFIVNQTQGSQPLSGSLANGIRMSASEVFVHELVHNVSMFGIDNKYAERNELYKLWLQAKKVVTVRDFMNDPSMLESDPRFADEYQAAEQRYKHVFEPKRDNVVNGRAKSNYLHEFVALGLTNNNFRKALSKIEYQNKASELNTAAGSLGRLVQGIYNWFNKLLNTLNAKLLSTYGKPVDQQLAQLFQSFAGIDSSNKAQLRKHMERVTEVFTKPVQEVINRVQPGIERNLVQPLDKFKKLTKKQIKEAVKNGKVQTVTEITNETYNKLRQSNSTAANLFLSLVTESKGRFNAVAVLHDMKRLANKNIDRYRMQVRNNYRTAINEAFAEKLTVQEKDALSYAFLKTDITSLFNDFSQDQIIELMRDKQYLAQTIQQYETNLNQYTGYTAFYIRQAKNLGKFMITGVSSIPNGLMNAKNIADAIGTLRTMPAFARQAEPTIDVLASLYAISNLSDNHRRLINGLVSKEVSRTDGGNGITFTMNLLKEFRSKTLEEFRENSRHIQKGFMTDKVNPDIAIKVGTIDDQEEFEAQGYAIGSALPKDPSDPDTETKYLFVNGHGGQPANIGGVAYLLNDAARGTSVTLNTTGSFNGSRTGTLDTWKTKNAKKVSANWNKRTLDSTTYAVPLVSEAGEIVDYRYVMNDNTKNDILQRDTSFDDVMGIMFSGLAVKNDIKKENKELVKVLKEMYTNTPNKAEFIEISPQSTNEEYREIFRLLPEDMKEEIRRVWGSDSMLVRKDSVDLLFGYHKYTAANLWKLSKAERGLVQEAFVMFVNMIFGKKAAMRVRQGEELLEALAKTVKDIIVIKTGIVTLGNMVSNMVLLKMMGVSIKDIIAGHKDSFVAMREYKKLNQETEQVRLKLSNAKLTRAQRSVYESKLVQLEDRLANNPVIDLIDAGLLSTIVEDVDTEVQEYKLSQRIKRKYAETSWAERLEDATNRIPNSVKDVFKEALVMQGSNLYDFLSEAAQFSDFGARYVLFQHMTKNKGIAKDEAAGQVMDIFIDYDLPTHKGIQYLNDLGLLMFSKYLVRVQRIIAKTFLENPARALSIMLLQNFFGDVPDIMDSTMIIETNPLTRLANPVESFINAAPDIITAKVFS
ncbi:viron-encapsulated RNA polymerase [Vibrio phage JA-1]|uniref:Viron-encapsulated RNA polymerase n=1 Tax=Vibrio phage JA-1 TaxID=1283071 RepID=R9R4M8_9CAUD|nr:virion RNA polymerase [Vibrio phage JA-1]AGI61805.1 viron-encapsulated RNA polymerase [Vibrio phage JA-1]